MFSILCVVADSAVCWACLYVHAPMCVQALGPEVPVKDAAQGALQKSNTLLNQAKQLQNDVQGNP